MKQTVKFKKLTPNAIVPTYVQNSLPVQTSIPE